MSPSSISAEVGDPVSFEIRVNSGSQQVAAYGIDITYDANILSIGSDEDVVEGADGFVSAVVWIGLMFFKKPADHRFHYGYYKMENLASGLAAVVMIGLAIYISFRSYNQFINPHPVETPIVGAIIAFIAAVIALSLGFFKYMKSKNSKMGSVKLEAFNTIKDGVASGLTVIALILSSQGIYIADGIVGF